VTFQRALLLLIAIALLAGLVPAGIALHGRIERELVDRARAELAVAPRVLADRNAAIADAMMMHAKEVAAIPELAAALARGDRARAVRLASAAAVSLGDADGAVVTSTGEVWHGPPRTTSLLDATRRGEMPVITIADSGRLYTVALAPVRQAGQWLGAAGVVRPLDARTAEGLAALTRSDVVLLGGQTVVASTLADSVARGIAAFAGQATGEPRELEGSRYRVLAIYAPIPGAGGALFVRDLGRELAVLPRLRRVALGSALGALVLSVLLGMMLLSPLLGSVRSLADASDRVAAGDFAAPLRPSRIRELARVSSAFDAMRSALQVRLRELEAANASLADHSSRLRALQTELMQRERLAAASQLVAQVAHEVRNPVANLRNCLEVIRKRLDDDPRGREFVDLAIDELLRMHEMAEQLLDLNRPRDPSVRACDVMAVSREVVALATVGVPESELRVTLSGETGVVARIAPDALKQVLLNIVRNAREAIGTRSGGGSIAIDVARSGSAAVVTVRDDGPGIPAELRNRIFDPFVSTKHAVHGVGLGLYVAEGLVRTAGGRITAGNNDRGRGAAFRIELPLATAADDVVSGREDIAVPARTLS
jgi:signal transduction histidine kinase